MKIISDILIVSGNLLGELWVGNFRKSNFYDKYTYSYKKVSHIGFNIAVLALLMLMISIIIRMGGRM